MTHRRLAAPALAVFAFVLASPAVAFAASPSPSVTAPSSASPSPAAATPTTYAAVNVSLVVSSGSVTAGGHVTVSGSGFDANEPVDLTVSYGSQPKATGSVEKSGYVIAPAAFVRQAQPMQVNADTAGAFSHTVVLSEPGMATITATGTVSQRSSSSTVNVLCSCCRGRRAASSNQPAQDAVHQQDVDAVGGDPVGVSHCLRCLHPAASPRVGCWWCAPSGARAIHGRLIDRDHNRTPAVRLSPVRPPRGFRSSPHG